MSNIVKRWIPTLLFATLPGLVVLFGYLFPNRLLIYYRGRLTEWRDVLVEWAVIVAAFAFLLGLFNIVGVHGRRVLRRRRGWPYSLVLLFAMLTTLLPPILPSSIPIQKMLDYVIFDYVISPLGASLAALMAFTLTLASFRLLRARRGWGLILGWGFILIVAVVLLGSTSLTGATTRVAPTLELLGEVRDWIVNVPGMAGMRGLLLGVALGTVITALRVLVTSDRPHSEF